MATIYEYKFVRQKLRGRELTGKFTPEYQEEIRKQASQGWKKFVQAFAPSVMGYGASVFVDLIFEKTIP